MTKYKAFRALAANAPGSQAKNEWAKVSATAPRNGLRPNRDRKFDQWNQGFTMLL